MPTPQEPHWRLWLQWIGLMLALGVLSALPAILLVLAVVAFLNGLTVNGQHIIQIGFAR